MLGERREAVLHAPQPTLEGRLQLPAKGRAAEWSPDSLAPPPPHPSSLPVPAALSARSSGGLHPLQLVVQLLNSPSDIRADPE